MKDLMNTITWIPGSNQELDTLFDELRQVQFANKTDRLYKNYSKDLFLGTVALTICFEENLPVLCSSICSKECWPKDTYRILNRLWKVDSHRKPGATKQMSISFKYTAESQIEWLTNNSNCRLYFISRQSDNWEKWVMRQFKNYNIHFNQGEHKYLTCDNELDDTCWQHIIYNGDSSILEQWKRKNY